MFGLFQIPVKYNLDYTFFLIRTSNVGAEAECSSYLFIYFFDLSLKTFLPCSYLSCVVYSISINRVGRDQESHQIALFAVMWYQVACHMVVWLALIDLYFSQKNEQNKDIPDSQPGYVLSMFFKFWF